MSVAYESSGSPGRTLEICFLTCMFQRVRNEGSLLVVHFSSVEKAIVHKGDVVVFQRKRKKSC